MGTFDPKIVLVLLLMLNSQFAQSCDSEVDTYVDERIELKFNDRFNEVTTPLLKIISK